MKMNDRIKTAPVLKAELMPFGLVFAHGFLFFVQAVVFTASSAIYHEIFIEVNVITRGEEEKTPIFVGYFTGAFFVGKICSDFIWGLVRDSLGDKRSINITSVALILSLVGLGFSWNLWSMLIFTFIVGLASGLFVPGLAFCNWIEVQKREKLIMWIYIFAGAGSLAGPFIGSLLFEIFKVHRMVKTFTTISVMMLVSLLCFNYAFSEYDDRALIDTSKYTELIEEQHNQIKENLDDSEMFEDLKRSSFDKKSGQFIDSEKIGSLVENVRYIESRKRLQNQSAIEMMMGSGARVLLVFACGIIWGVKLLEFMLFPIWAEMDRSIGGLGFSTVQTGAISLLNFPIMIILLLYLYKSSQTYKASAVMYTTAGVMFFICSTMPMVYFLPFSTENMMLIIVPLSAIKEVSNVLWITAWSNLFSKLFPGRTLGRIFSWSFLLGHVILAALSQVYPRLLTVFLQDDKIRKVFGNLRVSIFFSLLVAPMLLVMVFVRIAQKKLEKEEFINI